MRSSRGISLSPLGRQMYDYAKAVLRNVEVMKGLGGERQPQRLSVASYPSNMVARGVTEHYARCLEGELRIDYREGTVEEITDFVAGTVAEVGILYVSRTQMRAFEHIIHHKELVFVPIDEKEACLYVGKHSPLYSRDSVDFQELHHLRFIQGVKDFFSMEHHLEQISVGVVGTENLDSTVRTDSDHLTVDMLLYTDLCCLGIDFMHPQYQQYDIRPVRINGCDRCLVIGYVMKRNAQLSLEAQGFIDHLTGLIRYGDGERYHESL